MKKGLIGLLVLALAGAAVYAVAAADISGAWEMTTITQRGEQKADLVFVQAGEKLTVTQTSMRQGNPVENKGEGTIKGSDVEWKITRTTQRGEFTTIYKGKIVDDKTMKGTMEMSGMPGGMGGGNQTPPEWTAVRKAS
jgi:hypothetical protein